MSAAEQGAALPYYRAPSIVVAVAQAAARLKATKLAIPTKVTETISQGDCRGWLEPGAQDIESGVRLSYMHFGAYGGDTYAAYGKGFRLYGSARCHYIEFGDQRIDLDQVEDLIAAFAHLADVVRAATLAARLEGPYELGTGQFNVDKYLQQHREQDARNNADRDYGDEQPEAALAA